MLLKTLVRIFVFAVPLVFIGCASFEPGPAIPGLDAAPTTNSQGDPTGTGSVDRGVCFEK